MRDGKLKKKVPFLHGEREIEKKSFSSHMKEGKLRKISFLLTRNVQFCLFFIDKNSFFYAEREIEKNLFAFHAKCKIPYPFPSLRGHPQ